MNKAEIKKINAYLVINEISTKDFIASLGISNNLYYKILNGETQGRLIGSKSYEAIQRMKEIAATPWEELQNLELVS